MLECLIAREVEELGEEFEGEYETVRNTVKNRLGHLLHSTGALLENGEGVCEPLPEFQCVQVGKREMKRELPSCFIIVYDIPLISIHLTLQVKPVRFLSLLDILKGYMPFPIFVILNPGSHITTLTIYSLPGPRIILHLHLVQSL